MTNKRNRRNGVFRAGVAAIVAGFVVTLVGVLAAPASAASVDPTVTDGDNPTCLALGYSYEFKIDAQPENKDYTVTAAQSGSEDGTVTISNAGVVSGVFEFDWSSTIAWDAVIVKQGNGAHAFEYSPPSTGDTDLYPSTVNGQPTGGISHITFCRDDVPPCEDDPETTEDECNPCEDDPETEADECNPCVDDPETDADECNPCVDDPETDADECNPTEPDPTIDVSVLTPICDGDVPYLLYQVDTENVSDEAIAEGVDITWINPGGEDVVMTGLAMSGKILWPGAVVDEEGNALDWPGWTKQGDGTWVEGDEFDWVRPSVDVKFAVNPEITLPVAYPESSPACATPPEVLPNVITPQQPAPPVVQPAQLPRTGSSTTTLTLMGLGMVLMGAGAMFAGRREMVIH